MLKTLLQPFKKAQKLLEGETYVTAPFVPYMINLIYKKLRAILATPDQDPVILKLGNLMMDDYKDRWGYRVVFLNSILMFD